MKRLFAVLAVFGLLAMACGDDGATSSASKEHNQADVSFVTGMIPHHEQAVTMSEYASTRAASPKVKDIANRIEGAQEAEINQMKGLLKGWGVEAPGGEHGGHGGAMAGGHPGMLTAEQLDELESAKGQAFDRLFVQGMIAHHRGAVTSSEKELSEGQSAEAKKLAQSIIAAQKTEIAEMEALLATV